MRRLVALLALFSFSNSAFAQLSFVGPQASAMGGAGRAAIAPGESAFLNPASIPFFGEYFATGFYAQNEHPTSGETQQFGALLSDGVRERLFQGALGYVHSNVDPIAGGDVTNQDIFAAASSFVMPNLSFGLSARRFMYKINGGAETIQWNGSAGLMWVYSPVLRFGLVAHDLIEPNDSVPLAARLVRTYALGTEYTFEKTFKFRVDLVRPTQQNPDNNTDILTGFETGFAEYLALRSGFRWNESLGPEKRVFTLGFGFKGPRLRADYAFEKDTKVAGGTRHSFDLWMPF